MVGALEKLIIRYWHLAGAAAGRRSAAPDRRRRHLRFLAHTPGFAAREK